MNAYTPSATAKSHRRVRGQRGDVGWRRQGRRLGAGSAHAGARRSGDGSGRRARDRTGQDFAQHVAHTRAVVSGAPGRYGSLPAQPATGHVLSRLMRSRIGGCVENILPSRSPAREQAWRSSRCAWSASCSIGRQGPVRRHRRSCAGPKASASVGRRTTPPPTLVGLGTRATGTPPSAPPSRGVRPSSDTSSNASGFAPPPAAAAGHAGEHRHVGETGDHRGHRAGDGRSGCRGCDGTVRGPSTARGSARRGTGRGCHWSHTAGVVGLRPVANALGFAVLEM